MDILEELLELYLPKPVNLFYNPVVFDIIRLENYYPIEIVKLMPYIVEYNKSKILKKIHDFDGDPIDFKDMPEVLKSDKDFAMFAIKINGMMIQHFSNEIKNQKKFVIEASQQDPDAFQFAPKEIKGDKDFILNEVIPMNGMILKHVLDSLKNDKDLIIASLKSAPNAYKFIGESLKKDEEFMGDIFTNYLNDNAIKDIIKTTLDPNLFKLAPDNIRKDETFIKSLISASQKILKDILEYIPESTKSTRSMFMTIIKIIPEYYETVKKENFYGLDEKYIALDCYELRPSTANYFSESLLSDESFMLEIFKNSKKYNLDFILDASSGFLKITEDFAMKSLRLVPDFFRHDTFKKFTQDKDFMRKMIKEDPQYAIFADTKVINSQEMIQLISTQSKSMPLLYGIYDFFNEKSEKKKLLAIGLVKNNGLNLYVLPYWLKNDITVVDYATSQNIKSIQYASEAILSDENTLLFLFKYNGDIFDESIWNNKNENPVDLLKNEKTFYKFFKENRIVYKYADIDLKKKNVKLALDAVSDIPEMLQYVPDDLISDYSNGIAETAIFTDPKCIEYIKEGDKIRDSYEIMKRLVSKDGMVLNYVSERLRGNFDIVLAAVKQNPKSIRFVNERSIFENEEIAQIVLIKEGKALEFFSPEIRSNKQLVIMAVKSDQIGSVLQYVSDDLKNDFDVANAAVENYGLALKFVSDVLKDNDAIVLKAIQQTGLAIIHASERHRNNREIVLLALKNSQNVPAEYMKIPYKLLSEDFINQKSENPNEYSILFELLYRGLRYLMTNVVPFNSYIEKMEVLEYGLYYWNKKYTLDKEFLDMVKKIIEECEFTYRPTKEDSRKIVLRNQIIRIESFGKISKLSEKIRNIGGFDIGKFNF